MIAKMLKRNSNNWTLKCRSLVEQLREYPFVFVFALWLWGKLFPPQDPFNRNILKRVCTNGLDVHCCIMIQKCPM